MSDVCAVCGADVDTPAISTRSWCSDECYNLWKAQQERADEDRGLEEFAHA